MSVLLVLLTAVAWLGQSQTVTVRAASPDTEYGPVDYVAYDGPSCSAGEVEMYGSFYYDPSAGYVANGTGPDISSCDGLTNVSCGHYYTDPAKYGDTEMTFWCNATTVQGPTYYPRVIGYDDGTWHQYQ